LFEDRLYLSPYDSRAGKLFVFAVKVKKNTIYELISFEAAKMAYFKLLVK
tara:strand:+ start:258 stop:407 length:150 start_codon:yes stop_codon:yes gene_type:complete